MKMYAIATILSAALITPTTINAQQLPNCSVSGATLSSAISSYGSTCSTQRVDCDLDDGLWVCANFNNPTLADIITSQPEPMPETPLPEIEDDNMEVIQQPEPDSNRCIVEGINQADAFRKYTDKCSIARVDCDPVSSNSGPWICASFNNPTRADINPVEQMETVEEPPVVVPEPVEEPPVVVPEPEPITSIRMLPNDALFSPGDFVSVHYDSCPDPDDLHAAVSGKMVLDFYNLRRGTDYAIVNGTCGRDLLRSDFITASPLVFNQLYGNRGTIGTWLDAFNNEDVSANIVADKIVSTLLAGRNVYILEGGPSDFTAAVIRQVQALGFGAKLQNRLFVLQHAPGFNETNTLDANLVFVQNQTSYSVIPNGNRLNGTARLLQWNGGGPFMAPNVNNALVAQLRNDPIYGADWEVAFRIFNTNFRLDASDTVEMLWMFGLRSNDIANWEEFVNMFSSTASGASIPTTIAEFGPSTVNGVQFYRAATINAARSAFVAEFGSSPRDCDPFNGFAVCSSSNI